MMAVNLAGRLLQPHGLGHFIGMDVHDVGGYLEGQVWFSDELLSRSVCLQIALVADNERVKGRMHPNMLYITR